MKKVVSFLSILFLISTAITVYAGSNKGAPEMKIFAGKKKSVKFPHQKHQIKLGDCSICHTIFPMEKGIIKKRIEAKRMAKKTVMNKCRGCHKAMAKENKKTGPTACSKCHTN